MREAYYEESASSAQGMREAKFYTAFKVTSIICFVLGAIILSLLFFTFLPSYLAAKEEGKLSTQGVVFGVVFWAVPCLLLAGFGLLFWRWKNRYNLSYDYIFVEDELRVAKVFNGLKRKFYKRFNADMILKMGKCENDSFRRLTAGMGKKEIVRLTPNREPREGREFFYMLYSSSTEKAVYILECKTELIEYILRAAGRNKWESR